MATKAAWETRRKNADQRAREQLILEVREQEIALLIAKHGSAKEALVAKLETIREDLALAIEAVRADNDGDRENLERKVMARINTAGEAMRMVLMTTGPQRVGW